MGLPKAMLRKRRKKAHGSGWSINTHLGLKIMIAHFILTRWRSLALAVLIACAFASCAPTYSRVSERRPRFIPLLSDLIKLDPIRPNQLLESLSHQVRLLRLPLDLGAISHQRSTKRRIPTPPLPIELQARLHQIVIE